MPLQNRVTPLGELIADSARGLVYGNRGCLHDDHGRIRRRYNGKRWIACRLQFRGWQRAPLLQPGKFTELFFLDEATAFAAGHRPCALCRREDYVRFLALVGARGADEIDARLHEERLLRRHEADYAGLPDGAYVLVEEEPWLVGRRTACFAGRLPATPSGFDGRRARRRCSRRLRWCQCWRAEWEPVVPLLHPSAAQPASSSVFSSRERARSRSSPNSSAAS